MYTKNWSDDILMKSTNLNSLELHRNCYSKTCRGSKSHPKWLYPMTFMLLFFDLKIEAKWNGWKYFVKEQNELVTEHTPHKTLGLSPVVAHVLGFCKANRNIWKNLQF